MASIVANAINGKLLRSFSQRMVRAREEKERAIEEFCAQEYSMLSAATHSKLQLQAVLRRLRVRCLAFPLARTLPGRV